MDKLGSAWNALLVSYIGMLVLLLFFQFVYSSVVPCIAFMFILYLFYGGQSPLHQGCAPFVFGAKQVGSLMSAMLFATGVAMLIAPTLGAYIADVTGAYMNVFFVSAALMAVSTVLMLVLRNLSKKRIAAEGSAE
jgi:MFS family permease